MLESSVVGAEAPIPPVTFPLPESRYFRRPEFRIVAAGTPARAASPFSSRANT